MNPDGNGAVATVTVAVAVVINAGRCLIARRAPGRHLAGFWEFPGGKLEGGETPACCLQRELLEELAIEVAVDAFIAESCFTYESVRVRLLAYTARWESGSLTLRVHDDYAWVDAAAMTDYRWPPANAPILRAIIDGGWLG
ncbi:MAG: (deoxy)nucleoside triphosphate pyrophosphohydrolase [Sporomusaceae bacterium]|nr:(deoxy)nucleoside triphosphate pyrophosphohydrolase [Sporomusaceae bacterium]